VQIMNIKLTGSQEYKSRFREAMNRYILQGKQTPSIYAKLSKTVSQLPTAGINGSRSSRSRQRRLKARQWGIKLDLNNRRFQVTCDVGEIEHRPFWCILSYSRMNLVVYVAQAYNNKRQPLRSVYHLFSRSISHAHNNHLLPTIITTIDPLAETGRGYLKFRYL
jgi:hypothetical protein